MLLGGAPEFGDHQDRERADDDHQRKGDHEGQGGEADEATDQDVKENNQRTLDKTSAALIDSRKKSVFEIRDLSLTAGRRHHQPAALAENALVDDQIVVDPAHADHGGGDVLGDIGIA